MIPMSSSPLPAGDATLLRVYLNDGDRFEHHPLHEAIVLRARDLGLAGATVLRGPLGFGATHRVHTAKIVHLATDLPLVIELVDTPAKIEGFLPELDRMMPGGLITLQTVRVHAARSA